MVIGNQPGILIGFARNPYPDGSSQTITLHKNKQYDLQYDYLRGRDEP
jgi:hypothetical protein